ncbi:transglutaminase domain-containing protein [bacterium]|nr:transglutaminase domain-containing protein [bacterium]
MKFQVPEGMQDYVNPTEFCDCDCEEIKQKAEELTKNVRSPKEAAMMIFNYVRDQFPFALGRTDVKASTTLKAGEGYCVPKTNLQVALLRAIGIPARYHQVVLHKDSIKGIVSDFLYKKFDEKIWFHPWCECYLSGKWIACDLYLDKDTYNAAIKNGIISKEKMPSIDWDGERDLKIATPWMLEDVSTHSSYDEVCKKVMEEMKIPYFLMRLAFKLSNRHTKKLREKI